MIIDYYFHERIAIECQRLIDLSNELKEQFDDPDIPSSINYNVWMMGDHLNKAIYELRFAEEYGIEKNI